MRIADITRRLTDLGAGPQHRQRVLRHWTHALPHTRNKRQPEHWLPKAVVNALPALDAELAGQPRPPPKAPISETAVMPRRASRPFCSTTMAKAVP